MTGGIGCGKTTVSDLFALRGIRVVDTDVIAHQLTKPGGKAMPALVATFGSEIQSADGALNRVAMRQRVFVDAAQRRQLEAILHPLIYAEAMAAGTLSNSTSNEYPYVLLVVPLLVESGDCYRQHCRRILVVDCAESTQLSRLMARNHLSLAEAQAMLTAQSGRDTRRAIATDILENEGNLENLSESVCRLDKHFRELATESDCFS
jgi:dephospho-CoA kinase